MRGNEAKKKRVEVARRHWNEPKVGEKALIGGFGVEAGETWTKAVWSSREEEERAVRGRGEEENRREAGTAGMERRRLSGWRRDC